MTEYRLVGNAVVDGRGTRKQVAFNCECSRDKPTRADFERVLGRYCEQRGYEDPDLIDWYLA